MSTENKDLFIRNDGNEIQRTSRDAQEITLNGDAVNTFLKRVSVLNYNRGEVGYALTERLRSIQDRIKDTRFSPSAPLGEVKRLNELNKYGSDEATKQLLNDLNLPSIRQELEQKSLALGDSTARATSAEKERAKLAAREEAARGQAAAEAGRIAAAEAARMTQAQTTAAAKIAYLNGVYGRR